MRHRDRPIVAMLGLVSVCSALLGMDAAWAAPRAEPPLQATPQLACGPGARAETGLQGRVSPEDRAAGRAAAGFQCNAERVGTFGGGAEGTLGGFKVERYTDADGHDCAYYDTTLLLGTDLFDGGAGVNVLDMSDPTEPVLTDSLVTPAMLSPHESLVLSQERGILAAVVGNPATNVGIIDVYDLSADCRHPQLRSSTPMGLLGHESGLSPDGRTFYSASPVGQTIVAVDLTDPTLPLPLAVYRVASHGLSISADGNRAYVASIADGLVVLDVSEVQARTANPVIREVSRLDWTSRSIPQNAIPITIHGHPYLVEIDEFGSLSEVGAGRIIDIADEGHPEVVSNLRLDVHQPENFDAIADDASAGNPIQGYAAHYCNVPTRVDPTIVACSMILSGLRVFSIVDPAAPVEIAYYNAPSDDSPPTAGNYAMASPSFVPERNEIWYSDGFAGFEVVRLTNDVWPAAGEIVASPPVADPVVAPTDAGAPDGTLPRTGRDNARPFTVAAVLAGLAALAVGVRRRSGDVE